MMTGRGRTWNDVRGTISREIYWQGGYGYFDASTDASVTEVAYPILTHFWEMFFLSELEDLWWEVEIEFSSSGYYQPAKLHGRPEDCYPEEGSDDRTLVAVRIRPAGATGYDKSKTVTLSSSEADAIFELYRKEVEAAEPDWPERDDYE